MQSFPLRSFPTSSERFGLVYLVIDQNNRMDVYPFSLLIDINEMNDEMNDNNNAMNKKEMQFNRWLPVFICFYSTFFIYICIAGKLWLM